MKIAFYVFSGTGNTLRVCKAMADEIEKSGNETELPDALSSPIRCMPSTPLFQSSSFSKAFPRGKILLRT